MPTDGQGMDTYGNVNRRISDMSANLSKRGKVPVFMLRCIIAFGQDFASKSRSVRNVVHKIQHLVSRNSAILAD
jgi:hypothetical protein